MNTQFEIHPRLNADSVPICTENRVEVRLIRQALVPWIILLPQTAATEWVLLEAPLREAVMSLQDRVSTALLKQFKVDKINTALIGNVVQQMHLHVIGRNVNDAFWPDVVWGKEMQDYEPQQLENLVAQWRLALS